MCVFSNFFGVEYEMSPSSESKALFKDSGLLLLLSPCPSADSGCGHLSARKWGDSEGI